MCIVAEIIVFSNLQQQSQDLYYIYMVVLYLSKAAFS